MALTTSSRGRADKLHLQTSPERTKVWTEPSPKLKPHSNAGRRTLPVPVPVVYYLSRNGQLEHPHFMEVPLSSSQGLFLKDVINRLNLLRGKGMANHYSWSSKRSYKNGYVWHDLDEHDFIHPVHGHEYVLKGSEINNDTPESPPISKSPETTTKSDDVDPDFPINNSRRRNQSWTSIDLEKRGRQREELSREETSPPPSDSSPETLESLMKADGRIVVLTSSSSESTDAVDRDLGGKMRPSSVLMSLISCGSASFRDCGAAAVKDHGLTLVSGRLPRGEDRAVEEKEYFSGSWVAETRKDQQIIPPAFKRSSSYNADRASHLKVDDIENEDDGVRAKCIPRRAKVANPPPTDKESRGEVVDKSDNDVED